VFVPFAAEAIRRKYSDVSNVVVRRQWWRSSADGAGQRWQVAASCQNQDGTPARIRPISTQRTSAQVTAVAYPDICLWIHNIAPQTNSHKAKTSSFKF